MGRIDPTVRRETGYIATWVVVFSALMQAVFLVIGKWDMTVLYGNLLSGAVGVLNFFLMGLTVQKAVTKDEKAAASLMKGSQMLRLFMIFLAAVLGAVLPCFHLVSALVPLFFPRIAVMMRPMFQKKDK